MILTVAANKEIHVVFKEIHVHQFHQFLHKKITLICKAQVHLIGFVREYVVLWILNPRKVALD